jgi:ABC-type branched-subunit amino acid transport system ATPase component/predicted MFS family arabinose efflux permease
MTELAPDALRDLYPSERELAMGRVVPSAALPTAAAAPEPSRERRRPALGLRDLGAPIRPLLILSVIGFNTGLDATAIVTLLPEVQTEFGVDLAFIITFGSIVGIVTALMAPLMGYLSDRVSRVWMVRVGGLLGASSTFLQGVAPGTVALVGARTAGGVGGGVSGPASYPLFTDYFPVRSRARVIAVFGLFSSLGSILGPVLSGHLADAVGWRQTLQLLGGGAIVVALLTFLLREPPRGYFDRLEQGADESLAASTPPPVSFGEGWRAATSISTLRRLWMLFPVFAIAGWGSITLLPLYFAQVYALSPGQRGNIATASEAAGLLGLLASGAVGDRLLTTRPARLLLVGGGLLVAQACVYVGLGFAPWLWLSVALTIPLGFISTMLIPSLLTLVSLVIPPRIRGFGIQSGAWFQMMGLIAVIMLSPVLTAGGLRPAFYVLAPVVLLGALILASAAPGFARDMRAAAAASMAEEDTERARQAGRTKLVICRDVDVAYSGVQVLFNVDFDVEEGEIVALLGTNGAGKSTLMRAIAGIQQASNGAIFFDGQDVTHLPPHESAGRGIVMMPGGHAVFPSLTVQENLEAATWLQRADPAAAAAGIAATYERFPILLERRDTAAGNLSGGEQQMVGLSQALLMQPKLLMVDELSLGLAPKIVEQLLDALREIHAQGTTIIIVEQSLNVALTIARRAVFMEKGEIRFSGATEELLRRPDLIRSVFMGGHGAPPTTSQRGRRLAELVDERLLDLQDVGVSYGGVQALSGVSLHVQGGEVVGLIGPNGAGKTTLFDVISGFLPPSSGTLAFRGLDISRSSPDARARLGLGRSFQNARLFPSLTVREALATTLEKQAVKSPLHAVLRTPALRDREARIAERIDDLIDLMGLGAYADKFVGDLSTGTRRAVDIAAMMAFGPRLLLLDEPSSGLAQAETEQLGPVLMRVAQDTGCGILIIEHDLPLITSMSDRLIALELGKVIAEGTPTAVVNDPRVLSAYLSASEAVPARSDAMHAITAAVSPTQED